MSVVACPKCCEEVTVPPRAPREAVVRCPLCYETYTLGDALATAPPMLEVIEMPSSAGGYDDDTYADDRVAARQGRFATAGAPSAAYDQAKFARDLAEEEADQEDLNFAGGDALPNGDALADADALSEVDENDQARMPVGRTPVKRQPLHPPGSKKKRKQASPIGSMIAIILGGAMAIPAALLLLLWLPSGLHKDPFKLAPLLNENAPFLLPSHLQGKENSGSGTKPATTNKIDTSTSPQVAANNTKKTIGKTPDDNKGGLNLGNKFDDALNGKKPEEEMKPAETPKVEDPLKPELPSIPDPLTPPETKPAEPKPEEPKPVETKPETPVVDSAALAKALETFTTVDTEFGIVLAGDDKDAKRTVGAKWYQSLTALASQIPADTAPVDDAFNALAEDAGKARVAGILALNAIKAEARKTDGIVLSGTVKNARKAAGGVCEMTIEVAANKPTIVVIGTELPEGSKVLIAGKIIDDPSAILFDYSSSDPKAVQVLLSREIK